MFQNNKILVTGCYGFVAQHLIFSLLKNNNHVVGIYSRKHQKNIFNINKFIKNNKYKIIKGNITNPSFLKKLIQKKEFDICYHLAAKSQVLDSIKEPKKTYNVNVLGTLNLLETFKRYNSKINFIFSSSDKVYEESRHLSHNENIPLNTVNPYDTSKICADLICRSYATTFSMKITVTRFVNIYGPGDLNWDRIIPGTIKNLIKNRKPVLRSNGKFIRDYVFIDDVIKGYILLANKMVCSPKIANGQVFTFGSNNPIKVIDLVKKILKLYNKKLNFMIIKNQANNEIKDRYSNYKLVKKVIGWSPTIKLEEGLKLTIKWYAKSIK